MEPEKVIFRRERNPITKGVGYLACFPDDPSLSGNIACVPLYFDGHNRAVFEPYEEVPIDYYYRKTWIIHRNDPDADRCLKAIQEYYGAEFRVVEKIM